MIRLSLLMTIGALTATMMAGAQRTMAPTPAVLDLGHPLAPSDPSWSGGKVFEWTPVSTIAKDGYFAGRFSSDEHFGTHLDAPAHFAERGWTVDRIPVERLVRPAVCINVTAQTAKDPDYRVGAADIEAFEKTNGQIAAGALVLIATGWDSRWSEPARYMNARNGVKHFPGLSVEAAARLAHDRQAAGIGIDTASIDYGPSQRFEAHRTTMPLNVYHVENAANLTKLPAKGFTVVVAPIDIKGGSGGPTRMFALLR